MSTASTTTRTTSGRALNIGLWVLQGLLAIGFTMSGVSKLVGVESTVQLFDDIGIGQWFRYVVGALEVAGAVGLLIPRLAGLAALGLVGVMAGAAVTDAFIVEDGNPTAPLVLLVLSAIVAWGRRDRTRALLRARSAR
jgi:putative oxidoreductase